VFEPNWLDGVIAMWLVSAVVGSLPEPHEDERWYGALYRFLQVLASNLPRLVKSRKEGPK
jgi:hypothetical protein